jgi:uroporphyrinogen-III synthase
MNESHGVDLRSLRVWVTRSEPQAQSLCALLEETGAKVVAVPTVAIRGPVDQSGAKVMLATALARADLAVFTSRNAVDWTWRLQGGAPSLRATARVLAVGPATAAELQDRGIDDVLVPDGGADSEALLALPLLTAEQVNGQRVLIVRGNGGRALLGDTLQARGAVVDYVEIYRRCVHADTRSRMPALWREQPPGAIVASSPAGLQALIDMTDNEFQDQLHDCPLLTIGDRLAGQAAELGFRHCYPVAATGGDAAVLEALVQLAANDSKRGPA